MIPCEVALDQYYKEHLAVKAVDRRRAEYAIDALNGFFAGIPLGDVDIPLCREYADARAENGVTGPTVRRELGVLKAAAGHAQRWKRITLDKMPTFELPDDSEPRRIWLFKDELSAFLDVAEREDYKVYRFSQLAYHTASRKEAIEKLEWPQVDTQARRINLSKPTDPKTKKRRPIVPVSPAMAEELIAMQSTAGNQWVLGDPSSIYGRFCNIADKAGLLQLAPRGLREAGRLSPHILRHSRATHLLQDGKNPFLVANLLGDTLTTVLRVYAHACPESMEEVVA